MEKIIASIRPKWSYLIFSGQKTIELRKSKPKTIPFKTTVYCTKASIRNRTITGCMVLNDDQLFIHPRYGLQHGDSICLMCEEDYTEDNFLDGKVIGGFICSRVIEYLPDDEGDYSIPKEDLTAMCLTMEEVKAYGNGKPLYGWVIENPKLSKPKTLTDVGLERAPQSWQYFKEEKA